MRTPFEIIFSFLAAILTILCSYKTFQIFQLSSYKVKGVMNWFKITKFDYLVRYFSLAFLSFVGMFVYLGCFAKYEVARYFGSLFFVLFAVIFIIVQIKEQKKTPLKMTPRMIRAHVLAFVLFVGIYYALLRLGRLTIASYSLTSIGLFIIPFVVMFVEICLAPIEKLNNLSYKKRAMNLLQTRPKLIKIGITGSYGKTTAKFILAKMLDKKYKVCCSPSSYNTPMGISKVVNNELLPTDEVLIAEMGARNVGDIKELAQMVQPNYAMITAIGKQHMETFGSIENIVSAKYELVENMALGGLAIFNDDGDYVTGMYEKCIAPKFLTGSSGTLNANATYSNVKISTEGTIFDITINGITQNIKTVLLGKHIPGLVAMSAMLAFTLGLSLVEIAQAVSEIQAVPHRLEIIKRSSDMTIIDDAYNSNPEGSKNALEILSQFDGVKIIVTPGLVELGEEEKALNIKLGESIAKFADYALLLGDHAKDIKSGAMAKEMSEDKIFIVENLQDAVIKLTEIAGKKVVLFENDLPDNY